MTSFSYEPFDALAAEPLVRIAFALGLLAWSFLLARVSSGWVGLAFGCALVTAVFGFWMSGLPRPYGMLVEPAITERMATASVVSASGNEAETCFAREANPHRRRDGLVAYLKLHPASVIVASQLIPILLPAVLVMTLYRLGVAGDSALVAATSVLLFWPAGTQFLPTPTLLPPTAFWGDPWGAIGFFLLILGTVALSEAPSPARSLLTVSACSLSLLAETALAPILLALAGVGLLLPGWSRVRDRLLFALAVLLPGLALFLLVRTELHPGPQADVRSLTGAQLLVWATLAQPAWLALAAVGIRRSPFERLRTGLLLLAGGGLLLVSCALGADGVPLRPALGVYRLGLILCGAPAVSELAGGLGRAMSWLGWSAGAGQSHALLLIALGFSSPVYQVSPARSDPYYRLSLSPIPKSYFAPATWVYQNTPPDAVLSADSEMAPFLAIIAGRRFLRADTLATSENDAGRRQVEARILGGRRAERIREAASRYGVSHLVLNRAGGTDWSELSPADFEGRDPFRKVHQVGDWFHLFEITGGRSASERAEAGERSR